MLTARQLWSGIPYHQKMEVLREAASEPTLSKEDKDTLRRIGVQLWQGWLDSLPELSEDMKVAIEKENKAEAICLYRAVHRTDFRTAQEKVDSWMNSIGLTSH